MVKASVVYSSQLDGAAGTDLGGQITATSKGRPPDAVILFASPANNFSTLLRALTDACSPVALVGCSSAGEFISGVSGTNSACAVALFAEEMVFTPVVATGLAANRTEAAQRLASAFQGEDRSDFRFRSALVLCDALAGFTDELIEELTLITGGAWQFFGGGAGDNAQFSQTDVFCGTEVYSDAVVALEILSQKPLALGVRHGWAPSSPLMRVTEAHDLSVIGLNGAPAIEAFEEHARVTGQRFDSANPLPFFLHNVLGIQTATGFKLRVPLSVHSDGSISCAADIGTGSIVSIMRSTASSASEAAHGAAEDAMGQMGGEKPSVALFFDCVATRLRMGNDFDLELGALQDVLGDAQFVGCNTHGQIARSDHQFSGFHNCTAVVCLIPS